MTHLLEENSLWWNTSMHNHSLHHLIAAKDRISQKCLQKRGTLWMTKSVNYKRSGYNGSINNLCCNPIDRNISTMWVIISCQSLNDYFLFIMGDKTVNPPWKDALYVITSSAATSFSTNVWTCICGRYVNVIIVQSPWYTLHSIKSM